MLFRKLVHTTDDHTITVLRVVAGVIFFAHGAQKAFGWFGGPGFGATMAGFTQHLGVPAFFAVLAILAEFLRGHWTNPGIAQPDCSLRNHRQYGRGHRPGTRAQRLLHELGRQSGR